MKRAPTQTASTRKTGTTSSSRLPVCYAYIDISEHPIWNMLSFLSMKPSPITFEEVRRDFSYSALSFCESYDEALDCCQMRQTHNLTTGKTTPIKRALIRYKLKPGVQSAGSDDDIQAVVWNNRFMKASDAVILSIKQCVKDALTAYLPTENSTATIVSEPTFCSTSTGESACSAGLDFSPHGPSGRIRAQNFCDALEEKKDINKILDAIENLFNSDSQGNWLDGSFKTILMRKFEEKFGGGLYDMSKTPKEHALDYLRNYLEERLVKEDGLYLQLLPMSDLRVI